ncbi:MAG: DUF4159 domain-containing protein [Candidatus Poribacteria bacterium]|nr:DUF4159 domain-containing protein [Candidatus Poribacteria bacterium]
MPYVIKSLNQKTGLQTQLVDAVAINDAAFFEAPIVFMEHVPPSDFPTWLLRRPRIRHGYTQQEVQRLREYVVNRGGFIYLLTHGNTPQAMYPALKVLKQILPEHQLTFIPNEHEIYSAYYKLNGPLRFPIRKMGKRTIHHGPYAELQGIFIDGRLAVLVDTEAMMHVLDGAIQQPFQGQKVSEENPNRNQILKAFAPHAARQLINIVVYAVTHGKISDYSNYVPEMALSNSGNAGLWRKAPQAIPKL